MNNNFSVLGFLLGLISLSIVCTPIQNQNQNPAVLQTQSFKWRKISAPLVTFQEITFSADGDLYALGFMELLGSANNGQSWTKIKVDAPADYKNLTCVIVAEGVILVGAKSNGGNGSIVLRSSDGGKSWTHSKFVTKGGIKDLNYEIESLTLGRDGHLWAGADFGTVFRSVDKGKTWEMAGKVESFETVAALAFGQDGQLYAAVAKTGVFLSVDQGRTWAETGFGKNAVDSLVINKKGHLFAGTMKRGVLRSEDGGKTWTGINDGLPILALPALALDKDDYLYGGTATINGIFRSTDPT